MQDPLAGLLPSPRLPATFALQLYEMQSAHRCMTGRRFSSRSSRGVGGHCRRTLDMRQRELREQFVHVVLSPQSLKLDRKPCPDASIRAARSAGVITELPIFAPGRLPGYTNAPRVAFRASASSSSAGGRTAPGATSPSWSPPPAPNRRLEIELVPGRAANLHLPRRRHRREPHRTLRRGPALPRVDLLSVRLGDKPCATDFKPSRTPSPCPTRS